VPREGNVVGERYRLVSEIGQGAMGCVWKATHVTLGRTFAVKFLKPYDTDGVRREERFLREARLAASISHRFVVDIVDFGTTGEGTPYLVMEYLHGEGLDRRLGREPLMPVRELLRLMAEVLLGLEAVHAAGVVHRDVKPENILLTQEADQVVPKLVDFGISRAAPPPQPPSRATPLDGFGTVMGTPWYMSPEQASGRRRVDHRSDVFSVGVILYEALTGVPPFDGPSLEQVVVAVTQGVSTPLSVMRAELPAGLCQVVHRALERDPERRHERAEQMAAALLALIPEVPEQQLCMRPLSMPAVPPASQLTERVARRSVAPRPFLAPLRRPRSYAAALALLLVATAFAVGAQGTRARSQVAPPQQAVAVPALPVEAPLFTAHASQPALDDDELASVDRRPPRPRPARRPVKPPPAGTPDFFRNPGF
jgi:serine/threonine protein kinase